MKMGRQFTVNGFAKMIIILKGVDTLNFQVLVFLNLVLFFYFFTCVVIRTDICGKC